MKSLVVVFIGVAFAGCVTMTSDVVPVGRDTYQLSATGAGFSTQGKTNVKALKAANAYCEKINKKMVLQHSAESGVYGFSPRQNNLVFMCLNESDPAYTRAVMRRDADVVIRHEN